MAICRRILVLVNTIICIHCVVSELNISNLHEFGSTAQKTIWEISQVNHRVIIGMTDLGKVTGRLKTIQTFTARLAGICGIGGALFAILLQWTGPAGQESKELKYLKTEFGKLSEQIDNISRSVDDVKDLIKLQAQKSAYIFDETKINVGYDYLNRSLNIIRNISCANRSDCRMKKIAEIESFATALNVRDNVKNILKGVTSEKTFGNSLLSLLKEESKCNTPKINRFIARVASLMIKGLLVSMFHGITRIQGYEYTDDTIQASKYLTDLENKRRATEEMCLNDADYWIRNDVQNSRSVFASNSQQTNSILLNKLSLKWPWIRWHVITSKGEYSPKLGPKHSFYSKLVSSSKKTNIHSIAFPAVEGNIKNKDSKFKKWRHFLHDIFHRQTEQEPVAYFVDMDNIQEVLDLGYPKLQTRIAENPVLKNEIQMFGIVPGTDLYLGYYNYNANGTVALQQQELTGRNEIHSVNLIFERHTRIDIGGWAFVLAFNTQLPKCWRSCGSGKCNFLPYSPEMVCHCGKRFSGDRCEISETDIQSFFAAQFSVYNHTMQIPSLVSLRNTFEDIKLYLTVSLTNVERSILSVEEKINDRLNALEYTLNNKFKWFSVYATYTDSIQKLKYLRRLSNWTSIFGNSNLSYPLIDSFAIEHKEIATYILSPIGIQKWLYHLNYLIAGRYEDVFTSHQPMVFMVMNTLKHRACYADYKVEIDQTFEQLNLLQSQGFSIWIHALHLAGRDTAAAVAKQLKLVQDTQAKLIEKHTCHIKINNSLNLQDCSGYIHARQAVDVLCKEGYYLDGMALLFHLMRKT